MATRARFPQAPGQIPQENKNFREFKGMNTQAARQGIEPEQFAWLENAMPIGFGNLRVVPWRSASRATITAETVYYMKSFNRANVPYMFVATTQGSAYQILLNSPYTKTTIAAAATFPTSGTQIAQWKNERILIINANNYYGWDGTTLTVLGGTTSAPTAGQCIATYAGRVWISQNRTINYSTAGSYTDFGGSGGNTIISDETLTSDIQQLLSANNFLYFFGISSINVIADVQVVGGVAQFSNTNISANSGSNLPQSITPYYRAIWYANAEGIFGMYGATPRKASDDLDGIFRLVDFSLPVTGAVVSIYNILCFALCFTYNDGTGRKLIALYFNKKWFLGVQGTITFVESANVGGVGTLWATDGLDIYQLFTDTTTAISSQIKTALWDMGDYIAIKQSLRVGVEATLPGSTGALTVTVDTESQSQAPSVVLGGTFAFMWFNSLAQPFTWLNSLGQTFTWELSGNIWFQGDVETDGHYLGITSNSMTPQVVYQGLQLQYRKVSGWGA